MKEVKLVASDMDHTLLTEKGELPPNFYQYIHELNQLNIDFVVASGRPLYTLTDIFHDSSQELTFISDNGGVIARKGKMLYKSLIDVAEYQKMITFAEEKTDGEGISILCGLEGAYVLEKHRQYEDFLRVFYSKINFVPSLHEIITEVNKFTIYFPNEDSKKYYDEIFEPVFSKNFAITIGDTVWVDITNKGVTKGEAMRFLGKELNIKTSEMMAFGDTFNDIEMLKAVKYSYIVANASPEMKEYANFTTKSNEEYGVTLVLEELIAAVKNG